MIDPRTTNIIGQRVLIRHKNLGAGPVVIGRGVVRVVDSQQGYFALLIEAIGTISHYYVNDGSLFQISLRDEMIEIIVDREEPPVESRTVHELTR